jgi:hypothetical protein
MNADEVSESNIITIGEASTNKEFPILPFTARPGLMSL